MTPDMDQSCKSERSWIAALCLAAMVMYFYTFRDLWSKWMDETQYSLGFLVPLVVGYFVWRKWPEAKRLKRSPSALGGAIIVFAIMLHLAGTILDISGPSSVSMILLVLGGCLYFHGWSLVHLMGFPLAYSVFMIPVPGGIIDRIGLPMQLMASSASAQMLKLFVPNVAQAGIQISVDGFRFEVAPACSGISSLVALVGVTAVFAYLTRLSAPLKWLLFAMSLPIALAANIVRITSIGVLGHYWDWDTATKIYHDWSSPMLFVAAIIMLFSINGGLEWLSARSNTR